MSLTDLLRSFRNIAALHSARRHRSGLTQVRLATELLESRVLLSACARLDDICIVDLGNTNSVLAQLHGDAEGACVGAGGNGDRNAPAAHDPRSPIPPRPQPSLPRPKPIETDPTTPESSPAKGSAGETAGISFDRPGVETTRSEPADRVYGLLVETSGSAPRVLLITSASFLGAAGLVLQGNSAASSGVDTRRTERVRRTWRPFRRATDPTGSSGALDGASTDDVRSRAVDDGFAEAASSNSSFTTDSANDLLTACGYDNCSSTGSGDDAVRYVLQVWGDLNANAAVESDMTVSPVVFADLLLHYSHQLTAVDCTRETSRDGFRDGRALIRDGMVEPAQRVRDQLVRETVLSHTAKGYCDEPVPLESVVAGNDIAFLYPSLWAERRDSSEDHRPLPCSSGFPETADAHDARVAALAKLLVGESVDNPARVAGYECGFSDGTPPSTVLLDAPDTLLVPLVRERGASGPIHSAGSIDLDVDPALLVLSDVQIVGATSDVVGFQQGFDAGFSGCFHRMADDLADGGGVATSVGLGQATGAAERLWSVTQCGSQETTAHCLTLSHAWPPAPDPDVFDVVVATTFGRPVVGFPNAAWPQPDSSDRSETVGPLPLVTPSTRARRDQLTDEESHWPYIASEGPDLCILSGCPGVVSDFQGAPADWNPVGGNCIVDGDHFAAGDRFETRGGSDSLSRVIPDDGVTDTIVVCISGHGATGGASCDAGLWHDVGWSDPYCSPNALTSTITVTEPVLPSVDVLFVIDATGSMGEYDGVGWSEWDPLADHQSGTISDLQTGLLRALHEKLIEADVAGGKNTISTAESDLPVVTVCLAGDRGDDAPFAIDETIDGHTNTVIFEWGLQPLSGTEQPTFEPICVESQWQIQGIGHPHDPGPTTVVCRDHGLTVYDGQDPDGFLFDQGTNLTSPVVAARFDTTPGVIGPREVDDDYGAGSGGPGDTTTVAMEARGLITIVKPQDSSVDTSETSTIDRNDEDNVDDVLFLSHLAASDVLWLTYPGAWSGTEIRNDDPETSPPVGTTDGDTRLVLFEPHEFDRLTITAPEWPGAFRDDDVTTNAISTPFSCGTALSGPACGCLAVDDVAISITSITPACFPGDGPTIRSAAECSNATVLETSGIEFPTLFDFGGGTTDIAVIDITVAVEGGLLEELPIENGGGDSTLADYSEGDVFRVGGGWSLSHGPATGTLYEIGYDLSQPDEYLASTPQFGAGRCVWHKSIVSVPAGDEYTTGVPPVPATTQSTSQPCGTLWELWDTPVEQSDTGAPFVVHHRSVAGCVLDETFDRWDVIDVFACSGIDCAVPGNTVVFADDPFNPAVIENPHPDAGGRSGPRALNSTGTGQPADGTTGDDPTGSRDGVCDVDRFRISVVMAHRTPDGELVIERVDRLSSGTKTAPDTGEAVHLADAHGVHDGTTGPTWTGEDGTQCPADLGDSLFCTLPDFLDQVL